MVDASRPQEATAQAEQLLSEDRFDLAAHCGLVLAAFDLGPQPFLSATERLIAAIAARLSGTMPLDLLRLAVETADQVLRRAELLLCRYDQRSFAPPVLAMFADLAGFVAATAARIGDPGLEMSGRQMERRYWLHRDPTSQQVLRAYWHPDSPLQLQVEVTNHCNLKCTMCPRTSSMTRPLGHMDLDVWDGIIQSWSGREVRISLLNPLTRHPSEGRIRGGVRMFYLGEFLMHPQFERIVGIAAERDSSVGVQTNGLLLIKKSVRQRLLDAAPSNVSISIDGFDAASYESLRAGGRWESVKRGIELFLAERKERGLEQRITLSIATIVADDGEATRERVRRFLQTIGDGSLPISFLRLSTTNPASFIDASGNLVPFDFQPQHRVDQSYPSCLEPLQKMQILWDGAVSACCVDANGVIRVGHVGLGVDEVWNGPDLRRLKEAHLRHDLSAYPICQGCLGVDASARPVAAHERH